MATVVPEPFELVTLPWESQRGRWSLSVCLRGSFALVHGGPCEPLEPQGVSHTVDGSWDEAHEKILHLADLVPFKPRADVLVLGHAWAPWARPVRALVARMRIGTLTKAVRVVGDRPWRWVGGRWVPAEPRPFTKMALRWEGAARSPTVPVGLDPAAPPVEGAPSAPTFEAVDGALPGLGPIAPGWPQRYGLVDEDALEWALSFAGGEPVAGGPPPRFPFQFFNLAPPDQQLDLVRPGAPLVLEHLSTRWPLLATHLPGARPRVARAVGAGRRADVALRCDTLWIDADRGSITMLWRGLIDVEGPSDRPELFVTVEGLEATGAARSAAVTAPAARPPGRLEQTQDVPVAAVDQAMAALPFAGAEPTAGGIADDASTTEGGQPLGATRLGPAAAPPVAPPARVEPARAEPARMEQVRTEPARVEPARREQARTEPARVEPARVEPARVEPARAGPARVEPARVEPPPAAASQPAAASATSTASAPPPPAPEPTTSVDPDAIDLATCAAIAAELAHAGADRAAVLATSGLDEAAWARVDRRWKQAIDQDARKGSTALLEAYDDAFLQALGRRAAPIDVAAYARIKVAQKRGDLAEVLEALRFPRIELLRLTRVWTRRAKADASVAAELEAAVQAEEKRGA